MMWQMLGVYLHEFKQEVQLVALPECLHKGVDEWMRAFNCSQTLHAGLLAEHMMPLLQVVNTIFATAL